MGDLSMLEILGLVPLGQRLREARLALAGDAYTPKSRFDHSSLRILEPTPERDGWSVRKRQVRDFRGGALTTRFAKRRSLYTEVHPRTPRLNLPFAAADYDGVAWE